MPKPRYNPETQRKEDYLTLKESFRDKAGKVHTQMLLTVGFLPPEVRPEGKGGTKSYEKVIERTGRSIQKNPSVSKFILTYTISITYTLPYGGAHTWFVKRCGSAPYPYPLRGCSVRAPTPLRGGTEGARSKHGRRAVRAWQEGAGSTVGKRAGLGDLLHLALKMLPVHKKCVFLQIEE